MGHALDPIRGQNPEVNGQVHTGPNIHDTHDHLAQ